MKKRILIGSVLATVIVIFVAVKRHFFHHSSHEVMHNHDFEGSEGKTLYTCGMHPNVIHDKNGNCPICHMKLTPIRKGANNPKKSIKKENKKVKHWVAPMDPTFISEKPGKSPMGMDLVPVYENDDSPSDSSTLKINPVVVQNMGVRIEKATIGEIVRKIRTIGVVEVAESEESVVNLRFSGWVEKIWADETEKEVKKGQKLFQIYSPELISAQEEFLIAVTADGKSSRLAKSAEKRLKLFELPQSHINRLVKTKNSQLRLIVRAPRSGYLLQKNVVLGAKVSAGNNLYRIGDLSNIWVKVDVYEFDIPWVKKGQPASMSLPFIAGKSWKGQVSFVHSTLDSNSRTLPVRLEFENPGLNLKPGMSATVYIDSESKKDVVRIPEEAIIRSGDRQVVFVSRGGGEFSAREVTTGLYGDRWVEILDGISAGENVVISGQFLLDSESQLRGAVRKMMAEGLIKE